MRFIIALICTVAIVSCLPGGRVQHHALELEEPAENKIEQNINNNNMVGSAIEAKSNGLQSKKKLGSMLLPTVANCTTFLKVLVDNNVQIKGDSKDSKHFNWLEVYNIKHKVQLTDDGDRDHDPISFVKNVDRASVALLAAFVQGISLDVTFETTYCNHLSYVNDFSLQARLFDGQLVGYETDKGVETWQVAYGQIKWTWIQTSESITDIWGEATTDATTDQD